MNHRYVKEQIQQSLGFLGRIALSLYVRSVQPPKANLQALPSYGRARTKSPANIFHVNKRQILALVLTRQNNCLKYYNASTIYYIHGMNFALSALANIQIQTFKIYVLILLRKSYLIGNGINCYRSTFIFYKTSCYIKVDKIS